MKRIKNIKLNKKQQTYLILFSIFIMMLVLNFLTPLIADDFSYSFGVNNKRITSIMDIIERQIEHYMSWGGRTIAHTLANFFLMFSKGIFNILNSGVYVLLVYLIYKHSQTTKEEKPLFLIFIHLCLYFLTPVFGQNCIWLIGSCNYLWTTVLILLFLLMYREKENKKDKIYLIIGMFLLGVISGWTNENTAFGLIVITLLSTIFNKGKEKLPKYKISGLIGTIAGFIIMIAAPGNYVRSEKFIDESSTIIKLIKRTINCTTGIMKYVPILVIAIVILMTIYIYKKKKIDKRVYIYLMGAFLTVYAMALSPTFPERAWFGVVVFLLIANMTLIYNIESIHKIYKFIIADIIIVLSILYVGDYLDLTQEIYRLKSTWDYRIAEIKTGKKKGQKDFEFPEFYSINKKSPIYGLADINIEAHDWPNDAIELYYDLDSVKRKID